MSQQYEVHNPIEERNLFTYAFLVPAVLVALSILSSIIAVVAEFAVSAAILGMFGNYNYGYGADAGAALGVGAILVIVIIGAVMLAAGIYHLVIWTSVSRDINTMCQGDAQSTPLIPFVGAAAICIFGLPILFIGPIYFYYYLYKMQDKMVRNSQRYGVTQKWSAIAVLLFGIFTGIGAYILLIITFNEMAKAYNASLGYTSEPQREYNGAGEYISGEVIDPAKNIFYDGGSNKGTLLCTAGESAGASIAMNDGDSVVLGRDPKISNIILRNDKKISRRHCTVTYRGGSFYVIDYSTNGVRLGNGQKLESGVETPLGKQAVIRLSDQSEFRVQTN